MMQHKPIWHRALPWLSVIAWASLIFYFSSLPSLQTNLGAWDIILRKCAHMVEFAVLCLLLCNAFRQIGMGLGSALLPAAAISLLYAFSDEFHQRYVPGRTSTLRDVGFDAAGIVIMSLVIFGLRHKRSARAGASVG